MVYNQCEGTFMKNLERFIKYAKIWTTSDENTHVTPSAEREKDLSRVLVDDLKELGVDDAYMDEWGNVYGHLSGEGIKIGLNAHIDTATNISGQNVKPQIIKNYQGGDIKLNENYMLSPFVFPHLNNCIGSDIIVTSGDTLLGADDKAGIAIILGVLSYFKEHPEIKHHPISICFTVDEEIGEGHLHFDIKKMDAEFAYSIDGSSIDSIDYENFNARGAEIEITGVAIHPGEGKGKLINAILLLNELIDMMPKNDTPFDSDGYDGYWHIENVEGNSESIKASFIFRDFDLEKLVARTDLLEKSINILQNKYPNCSFKYTIEEQYFNMKQYVEKRMEIIELAKKAMIENGINPKCTPIRGGTDGATFSRMGLITPNLGTGSYNHHGRFEYLVVDEFNKMIDIVVSIFKI